MQTWNDPSKSQSTVLYFTSPLTPHSTPCPLSLTYHLPSSRHLSTLLPPSAPGEISTVTEVDSAYCPQCFTSWDANSAFRTAKGCCKNIVDDNVRVGCISCPECESIIVTTIETSNLHQDKLHDLESTEQFTHVCLYKCGYCHWNSIDGLGIYSTLNVNHETCESENDEKEITEKAGRDLQMKLTAMFDERQDCTKSLVNNLILSWNNKLKSEEMERRKMELLMSRPRNGSKSYYISIANKCSILSSKDMNLKNGDSTNSWSIEKLNEFIDVKMSHMMKQVDNSLIETESKSLNRLTFDDLSRRDISDKIRDVTPLQSIRQLTMSSVDVYKKEALLPIPVKLRTRAVRRDCKELESGKPGILVKPKVNPLEGDSSVRYGQGQWWKKDSSAIHTVPKLSIYKHAHDKETNQYALLIRIANPTLGIVRLKLHTSFDTTDKQSFVSNLPSALNNIVFRSFPLQLINTNVIPANNCKTSMDIITLEPIEDSFLDLKVGQSADKSTDIKNWENNIDWSNKSRVCDCKLVLQEKDTAYVQFMVWNCEHKGINENGEEFVSTPLALEIEIGDGSWESSLIQKESGYDDEKRDFLSFVVLPTWKIIN